METTGELYRTSSLSVRSSKLWRSNSMEVFSKSFEEEDDEEALKWAALEKLPTFARIRTGILAEEGKKLREVDIKKLGLLERRNLVERLVKAAGEDHEKFLLRLRERIDNRALPTLFNFCVTMFESFLNYLHILPNKKQALPILKDVSGIIKPQRNLDGHDLRLFKSADMLVELARREKAANIKPDPDIDIYMKAAAMEGQKANVVTDYIIKILGLEVCADTIVGDEMIRGISGGQKKRLTTGLFRLMAALGRNMIVATTCGSLALLAILALGGFILSRDGVKKWWLWGYWFSPLMYAQNSIAVNEFLGKKWRHIPPNSTERLGVLVLKSRGLFPEARWYWIGVGALIGYTFLFNFLFSLALKYLNPFSKPQAIIYKETLPEVDRTAESVELSSRGERATQPSKKGTVLPFEPYSLAFDEIRYAVDMPQEMKAQGIKDDRLELLKGELIEACYSQNKLGDQTILSEIYIFIIYNNLRNKALIKELRTPAPGSKDLHFKTRYAQPFLIQCLACLWKQHWSYWRNPPYTAVRLIFTTVIAFMFGSIFWDLGSKRTKQQDILNAVGSMYAAVIFLGLQNAGSVQPVIAIERTVFYREKAAGMYSALPYAFGHVLIELPYTLIQTLIYGVIVYAMIGFEWTTSKLFWYLFFMYFTFLYNTFYGMMTVAVTPNQHTASLISIFFYRIWNVFSGFIIPRTRIPVWWRWFYWTCPVSWTLYGLGASQFGDVKDAFESGETVEHFVKSYLGFRSDFLTGILAEEGGQLGEVDIKKLGLLQRRNLVERLVEGADEDHQKFLLRLRERIDQMASLLGLGPPSSGKTTLLLALAGKLSKDLKAAAMKGQKASLVTDYKLKVRKYWDLMSVRDQMIRGDSGGQKKRVTTGKMLVGPAKALFMDEISTGLDSSTTFQIVNALKPYIYILNGTAVIL
ncbi:ABC-2 type transporter [Corchorus olitorius]|uniref:ABC-2 type transporter n=1 Tax=Corchorus olitorius TaxID=93759 RepID=A0A1R3IDG7_9ROSI|nr:ABC-2 type transporter [Corchorus olitorius]